MSNDKFPRENNKKTSSPLLLFIFPLVIACSITIGFTLGKMSADAPYHIEPDETVATVTSTPIESLVDIELVDTKPTENRIDIKIIDMTTPEYQLIMPEKPIESMSEFLSGVNGHERITIAYLHACTEDENKDYLRSTYLIDMFRQKSMLDNAYNYFIEIDCGVSDGMSEDSIVIKFDESNVDNIWAVITAAIDEYNKNASMRNNGELEYDKETWIDIFEMIKQHLSNTEIKTSQKIDGIIIIDP